MKTIITYGTFDLFHYGHLRLLERAKKLGEYLIVGVSTDEFNAVKNKSCVYSFEHRQRIVESIVYVDKVIPEISWEQKWNDIKRFDVDVLVMGDDWEGKFDQFRDLCKVVYLNRTTGISTTSLKANKKTQAKR